MPNLIQCIAAPALSLYGALLLVPFALPVAAQPTLSYLDSGQWTFNQDCVVRGDTVCTSLAYGAQIWDARDAANPVMLGDFYLETHKGYSLDWESDLLAVSTADGLLYLLDISDPAQPGKLNEISGLGSNPDIALLRDGGTRWGYSAGNAGDDFQIRDLTSPGAPVLRGTLDLAGQANSIAVLPGDIVLVLAKYFGIYSINVSDPDGPGVSNSEALDGTLLNISADGSRAAVASAGTGTKGFYTVDISDPSNPVQQTFTAVYINEWYHDMDVREVAVDGTTLHVIAEDVGLLTYDITDLSAPILTGYDPQLDDGLPAPYYAFKDGQLLGDRFYACHWDGIVPGVVILDATTGQSDYLGRTTAFDYVRFTDVENGMVYGCTGHMGVFAHEHVSETEFAPRGNLHIIESWGVDAVGSMAYIASTTYGLIIGDFSNPDSPQERGSVAVGQARGVEVHGAVAYVAAFTQGFHTVSVNDPDYPSPLDSYIYDDGANTMRSVNVSVEGGIAVTSDGPQGMNIWNVSTATSIVHLANYPTAHDASDVEIYQDYAYLVVSGGEGIHIIDISVPDDPQYLSSFETAATGCAVYNGYLYASKGGAGLSIYHVVNPENPLLLCGYNTTHTGYAAPCVEGNYIYMPDYSAIVALRYNPDTPVAVGHFALDWNGAAVTVEWEMLAEVPPEDMRLTARRLAPEPSSETELPFEPIGPAGFLAVDARAELAAGESWRYTLYSRDPGEDWTQMRSEQIVLDGTVPARPALLAAYPNPFNPQTTLRLETGIAGLGRLEIHDLAGRRVALLHEGLFEAGVLEFNWRGRDDEGRELASGVYFARLAGTSGRAACKLVLIR